MEYYKKKNRKIILGNMYGESQCGIGEENLPKEVKLRMGKLSHRFSWFAKEGDILVFPCPISENFKSYSMNLMGVDPEKVIQISLVESDDSPQLFNMKSLGNTNFINKLKNSEIINDDWEILAYYNDRFSSHLFDILSNNKYTSNFNNKFLYYGGAETLNSKSEFRRLAAGAAIPIAEGDICYTRQELIDAIKHYINITGKVIVKQDINASCEGNIVVDLVEKDKENKGCLFTLHLKSRAEINAIADYLWEKLVIARNNSLVVEAYYEAKVILYSEINISSSSPYPTVLNFGEMRMTPMWSGFQIPGESLSYFQLAKFIEHSLHLAKSCKDRGYVGKINCDAVLTIGNHLFFTEINGRLGGCSHIHEVATTLIGPDYLQNSFLLTECNAKFNGNFIQLLELLRKEDLLFSKPSRIGVVILEENLEHTGTFEYMCVGYDSVSASAIEKKLIDVLKE